MILCPICHTQPNPLMTIAFSGIGNSLFNGDFLFLQCPKCQLIYNPALSPKQLTSYYEIECNYCESQHYSVEDAINIERYAHYYQMMKRYLPATAGVVDVGCGRGGFIQWLSKITPAVHTGLDIDLRSLPQSEGNAHFAYGHTTHLPFAANSQQALCYFHVFEHLPDPINALQAAHGVLKENGLIVIESPDASRYSQSPVHTFFWPGVREHVLHFSPLSLVTLLATNGFELLELKQATLAFPSNPYPSLLAIARKTPQKKQWHCTTTGNAASYFTQSYQQIHKRAEWIIARANQFERAVFWGFGYAAFTMLPLCEPAIPHLLVCDSNKNKQREMYRNHPIYAPEQISPDQACLFIAAPLYTEQIRQAALHLGWDNSNIFPLLENE